ncbi:hypothetical protein E8E13_003856 [Curvularia kusanoi]|uniref:Uncharacterized protein n=1 Tax=Curvularia kusanoi TaxID=90978 RepID=A0A9P4T6V9_CURKU|nr:hypothetical protein E8E13_003856 [Curvularia kusanoi]
MSSPSPSSSFFNPPVPPPNTPSPPFSSPSPSPSPSSPPSSGTLNYHISPAHLLRHPILPTPPVPTSSTTLSVLTSVHERSLIQPPPLSLPNLESERVAVCPESVRRIWQVPERYLLRTRNARGVHGDEGRRRGEEDCVPLATARTLQQRLGLPGLYPAGLGGDGQEGEERGDGGGEEQGEGEGKEEGEDRVPAPSPITHHEHPSTSLPDADEQWYRSYRSATTPPPQQTSAQAPIAPSPPPQHQEDLNASLSDGDEQWYRSYHGARTPPPLPSAPAPIAPPPPPPTAAAAAAAPSLPTPHPSSPDTSLASPPSSTTTTTSTRLHTRRVSLGLALVSACERKSSSEWLTGIAAMRWAGVDMDEFYGIMKLGSQERERRKKRGTRNREMREGIRGREVRS